MEPTIAGDEATRARHVHDPVARDPILPILVAGYGMALMLVLLLQGRSFGEAVRQGFLSHLPFAAATIGGGALMFYLICVVAVVRPPSPFAHIVGDVRTHVRSPAPLYGGIWLLVLLVIFTSLFSAWKAMIPELQPFSWDERLFRLDRWMHGGTDPWVHLHRALHTPFLTAAINVVYHLWFFVMHFTYVWVAFNRRRPELRAQFLLAFYASWVVMGTALAITMSSAGPCYYGFVVGLPDPYAPLLAQLQASDAAWPVWALNVQSLLWEGYRSGDGGLTSAISAMPSMHLATTTLIALLAWRFGGALAGACGAAFLLCILVGSVHLGWHYAVDGYAGILFSLVLWWVCGYVVRYRYRQRDTCRGRHGEADER
jgi:hypothetical protein